MIKLKQITTGLGRCYFMFHYDYEKETFVTKIKCGEVIRRLKLLRKQTGQPITLQNVKQIIIEIINELRDDQRPLPETFDLTPYINVDLE